MTSLVMTAGYDILEAVSYTHLDVYKRQMPAWAATATLRQGSRGQAVTELQQNLNAVSYTHLDVYKRQARG